MKRLCILALCTVLLVPACGKKKEKGAVERDDDIKEVAMNIPLAEIGDPKSSFFDDQLDAFVLEEGEEWDTEKGINIVQNEEPALSWVAQEDEVNRGFKEIYFDFDHYKIKADQEEVVQDNLTEAKQITCAGGTVVVEGHACHSAGSKTYNLLISEQRAQQVAYRLEAEGVGLEKMKIVGRGTEMPIILGGDKNVQAPNRRVEIFSLAA